MAHVIIRGSWGDITVERETGAIHAYDDHGKQGWCTTDVGYHDIERFDPDTLTPGLDACLDKYGETDILNVGYFSNNGAITGPEPDWREQNGSAAA